jgi:hypothetical protein
MIDANAHKIYRTNLVLLLAAFLLVGCFILACAQKRESVLQQQRPRRVANNAQAIKVGPKDDFQAVLNEAQPGDTILLQAGATFTGSFTLPYKTGTNTDADWITIRSSASDAVLPPEGSRITPQSASLLPKIVSPGRGLPALKTEPRAHHYRFIAVEFARIDPSAVVYDLIRLGSAGAEQDTLAEVPHHFSFDRCYIHGDSGELKRGIALNSAYTSVINSYISELHARNVEGQAICGWNGPGPFKIINNYLEGAGENLIFGGSIPDIPNLVASDIEIRRNYFYKPLSWRGGVWMVKNLFELKSARRVTIEGNVFENNWEAAMQGWAILFRAAGDSGSWAVIEDVSFTNNVVRHVASGLNVLGEDYGFPSGKLQRLVIRNNLFEDVSATSYGGRGLFMVIQAGAVDVTVDHNTVLQEHNAVMAGGAPEVRFVMTNNVMAHNEYGISGEGTGSGNVTISKYFPGSVIRGNVIAGADASRYPAGNYYPGALDDVKFVNRAAGNYRLSPSSRYKNRGTDGKDVGCDFDELEAAIQNVVSPALKPGR